MPTFSLLARIRNTNADELAALVAMLEAQTNPDWELVLVLGTVQQTDRQLAADVTAAHPRVRVVLRPADEALAWSVNALLPTLGSWTALLASPRDALAPDTLASVAAALAAQPEARLAYTDEESHNRWGVVSRRWDKGAVNPLRLRAQDYLRDLLVIQTSWLSECGGFERTTALRPSHDLALRTLDALGPGAIAHIPGRRYYRHRDHRLNARLEAGYDPEAIRRSLVRTRTPGMVQLDADTATVRYAWASQPGVSVLVLVGDDATLGRTQLLGLAQLPAYPAVQVQVLHRGSDLLARASYADLCRGLHWNLVPLEPAGILPEQWNQALSRVEDRYAVLLQGIPCNADWLARLVELVQLPNIGAVGARVMSPVQLRAPGVLGYRFDGWDWNSRGRFNELAVPHQTGALGPYALLLDLDQFRRLGGFDTSLPSLYGMDYSLRLDGVGQALAWTPRSQVLLGTEPPPADAAELASFRARWNGWSDRFGLHQPIG